ncbi:MAG: CHASE2 domain-containing protein, partial [Rhodospirillaceae bacterium]|nr:CHASE2 domain-containing protein [Rhodospirillaceae bacterium]
MLRRILNVLKIPPVVGTLLALGIFFLGLGVTRFGAFERAELYIYDVYTRTLANHNKTDPRVALVLADENDLTRYGWPLSDGALAELINAVAEQKPRAIGVDIYRDQPREPGTDNLDAAIAAHDNLFMVYKFPDVSGLGLDSRGAGIAPPRAAAERDQIGFADMMTDADGVVRRGILFLDGAGGQSGTSLSLQLAARALAEDGICLQSDGTANNFMAFGPCPESDDKPTPPEKLNVVPPLHGNDGAYVG